VQALQRGLGLRPGDPEDVCAFMMVLLTRLRDTTGKDSTLPDSVPWIATVSSFTCSGCEYGWVEDGRGGPLLTLPPVRVRVHAERHHLGDPDSDSEPLALDAAISAYLVRILLRKA
jgi:hypothetical protein